MKKSEGLGDTIEQLTVNTGIKKVFGDCKPCEKRRKKLNKMFPYKNKK